MRFNNFLNLLITDDRISKIFFKKLVTFGNQSTLYEYPDLVVTYKSLRCDYSQSDTGERRADSITRSRIKIYQILQANLTPECFPNYLPSFVTFTYERNETSVSQSFKDFKYALKKLKTQTWIYSSISHGYRVSKTWCYSFSYYFFQHPFYS